jgi:Zn-finger nucleic acid-binding protein
MPLMICPNDETSMQAVIRNGVEFDMCPQCRGVWLDRGELEKLMQVGREEPEPSRPAPVQRPPYDNRQGGYGGGFGERGERGEYGERGEHGYGRRRGSIFDIFD